MAKTRYINIDFPFRDSSDGSYFKMNKTEDKKSDTEVKTEGTQQKEGENKEKTGDQDKAMKELGDNMKSMVTLLTQLNNTLKNPLIVIPNGKKFH